MRRDLLALHDVGIVVWDLRTDNYLDSRVADFSQARVVPHNELDIKDQFHSRQACWSDIIGFDGIAYDIDPRHPCLFFPSYLHLRNNKSIDVRSSAKGMDEKFLVAARYDWKKPKKMAKTKPTISTQPARVAKGRISKATQRPNKTTKEKRK